MDEATALGSATPATFQKFQALLLASTQIKAKSLAKDPSLTPLEKARLSTVLPYNLDAWNSYPTEREKVYAITKGRKTGGIIRRLAQWMVF